MMSTRLVAASRLLRGPSVRWYCDPSTSRQRIYFANHASHLDAVVVWSALPPRLRRATRPVAGRDFWNRGAHRHYVAGHVFRAVLIDRGCGGALKPATALASVDRMAHELADWDSLIGFPEGTRSFDGAGGAFKGGLDYLSRRQPDVKLIPVYLENLSRILPKGESFRVPMLSLVTFGSAVPSAGDDSKAAFLEGAQTELLRPKVVR